MMHTAVAACNYILIVSREANLCTQISGVTCKAMLYCAGYDHPVDTVVNDLVDCLEDLALPLMQFTEALAVVQVNCASQAYA